MTNTSDIQPPQARITAHRVPEAGRVAAAAAAFGSGFSRKIEPVIFLFAETLSRDYSGGYWDFFTLSNGGFFMAPSADKTFHVAADNFFRGELSSEAFGIVCCLYAFSNTSFDPASNTSRRAADQFHLLRAFALDHPEACAIFSAID